MKITKQVNFSACVAGNLLATLSPKNYNTRQLRRPVKFLSCSLLKYEEFLIVFADFFFFVPSWFDLFVF